MVKIYKSQKYVYTVRQTDRHTDRQVDRQTDIGIIEKKNENKRGGIGVGLAGHLAEAGPKKSLFFFGRRFSRQNLFLWENAS
jgi:hypothetical protein